MQIINAAIVANNRKKLLMKKPIKHVNIETYRQLKENQNQINLKTNRRKQHSNHWFEKYQQTIETITN